MAKHEAKLRALKEMLLGLNKDLKVEYPGNNHIAIALHAIADEILVLEQRISQVNNANIHF